MGGAKAPTVQAAPPPPPPPPPPEAPPTQDAAGDAGAAEVRRRVRQQSIGRSSTVMSGASGVSDQSGSKKSLLGG